MEVCEKGGFPVVLALIGRDIIIIVFCTDLADIPKERHRDIPTRAAASCAREMDILGRRVVGCALW